MKTEPEKIIVGISQGDINGIGYEVIIKALADPRLLDMCTPIIYGSSKIAAYHRKALNINNFSLNSVREPADANPKRPNIINCLDDNARVELGKSTQIAGTASIQALDKALEDLQNGLIDVLVTAPVNKHNIEIKDYKFNGHTDYIAEKTGNQKPLMLMIGEKIKIGVVTGHIPLSEVPQQISIEKIVEKLEILNRTLIQDLNIPKPRIAVFGLNPHAGDNGLLGNEEIEIIIPAIEQAKEKGIMALGPYPADGFFGSPKYLGFDAILAMYHDQGLIPFKAMEFETGINYTAGISIIRTSPAHGTAYEIAGEGIASPDSFRQAIYWACDIFNNRKQYKLLLENKMDENIKPKSLRYTKDESLEDVVEKLKEKNIEPIETIIE